LCSNTLLPLAAATLPHAPSPPLSARLPDPLPRVHTLQLMVCRWSKASTIAAPPLLALPASCRVIVAATLKEICFMRKLLSAVPLPSCLQVLPGQPHNRLMQLAQCMFSSENKSFQPCSIATDFAGKGELFCHHVVSARVPIVEHVSAHQPPAATPAACTSARDERAGSGFTTSLLLLLKQLPFRSAGRLQVVCPNIRRWTCDHAK
jgi:hypothetical protein